MLASFPRGLSSLRLTSRPLSMGKKDGGKAKNKKVNKPSTAGNVSVPETDTPVTSVSSSGDLHLRVCVQPGSQVTEVVSREADHFRLRLSAPPVDGAANTELVKFLAKTLGLRKAEVDLVSGHKSKTKVLKVAFVFQVPLNFYDHLLSRFC